MASCKICGTAICDCKIVCDACSQTNLTPEATVAPVKPA